MNLAWMVRAGAKNGEEGRCQAVLVLVGQDEESGSNEHSRKPLRRGLV